MYPSTECWRGTSAEVPLPLLNPCLATIALALAHTRLVQPQRGVPGLFNQTMEDRPESVSFAVWILNRITTQPTDEEDGRNLADDA